MPSLKRPQRRRVHKVRKFKRAERPTRTAGLVGVANEAASEGRKAARPRGEGRKAKRKRKKRRRKKKEGKEKKLKRRRWRRQEGMRERSAGDVVKARTSSTAKQGCHVRRVNRAKITKSDSKLRQNKKTKAPFLSRYY